MGRFSKDEMTDEILAYLHISFITICPTVINAIKELRKNTSCLIKLKDDLRVNFKIDNEKHEEGKSEQDTVDGDEILPVLEKQ